MHICFTKIIFKVYFILQILIHLFFRYDRHFYVPSHWNSAELRVLLRFGSIHYYSIVYLNGEAITSHEGGHLPILASVTDSLLYGSKNLLTVAVNNTLTPATLPQGSIIHHSDQTRFTFIPFLIVSHGSKWDK